MATRTTADSDKPLRGRRLSWKEFTALTGREPPKAVNDNEADSTATALVHDRAKPSIETTPPARQPL